ncbi:choice-of-anchor I family protein [Nocardioides baculatus]|uniref:Choice-of-anchor I family protein n=1 Tax=Nocardioides baculatus TaxID=2801337 RepID=A0ABS1L7I9_9ACTN|nr:choice-of-anchor I family protein [Nocardioides baculatus]MBL0747590.1 choice-of-anchor I family protein [Nocardioides baculatus]
MTSTPRSRRLAALATTTALCAALPLGTATAALVTDPVQTSAPGAAIALAPVGTYETGVFDESAAEIVEYYAAGERLLVVNAAQAKVEVLDASDATAPTKLFDLQTTGVAASDGTTVDAGAVANSVAVREDGLGVIAVEADDKTDNGWLVFFDAAGDGAALGAVRVGALPDMVTITPDGSRAVVANEGEPAEDYSVDPEGTVSVVDLPASVSAPAQSAVRSAGFHAFEGAALPGGIRVYGGRVDAGTGTPTYPVSENLEPEYVAVDQQSRTAYVTLQEANGVAVVDLRSASVRDVWSLGTVDRSKVPFDASDRDGVAIRTYANVRTFRQPDAIVAYQVRGATYLVTANEGDTRDWDGYSEEVRVGDLGKNGLKPACDAVRAGDGFANVGRLKITKADGLNAAGTCYDTLYGFGGRDISVFTSDGTLVSDTGDQLERITSGTAGVLFNSDHGTSSADNRSDDKGPEPEGVAIGKVNGRTYAFVGLERVGGVMVHDVTDPARPQFVTWVNNRSFAANGSSDLAAAGDLGPEGITFIAGDDSPTGRPLVAVGNEVSGSTTLFDVTKAVRRGR